MNAKKLFIPFVVSSLAISLIALALYQHQNNCHVCINLKLFSPEVIRHTIQGFGSLAVVVYIFLYALNTISLLPPIAFMSLSAGFLFGPVKGMVALTLGSFLGTSATFFISRFFGGKIVEKFSKGKVAEFQEKLSKNGFLVILPMRLVGFPPWEVVNYVSGLSKIKYRDYVTATMIGIFPAIVIQVFFSDRLTKLNPKDPALYVAVGAFILLAVIPAILLQLKKQKGLKESI